MLNATTLFSENSSFARSSLGAVTGGDRAIFADDGTNLLFTANNLLYKYNGSTVSTISQSVVTNPAWVLFLNDTFVIGGDNQRFALSDTGDPDTWNVLNFGTADVDSDELIRGYFFQGNLYLFGSSSCEIWKYIGSGTPPVSRTGFSGISNIGIVGKYAITNSDSFMYWMSDDKKIYQGSGRNARPVNDPATSSIIEG